VVHVPSLPGRERDYDAEVPWGIGS
jgi:hypothetical protein